MPEAKCKLGAIERRSFSKCHTEYSSDLFLYYLRSGNKMYVSVNNACIIDF